MNFFGYMNYSFVSAGYFSIEEVPIEELISKINEYLKEKVKEESLDDIFVLFNKYAQMTQDKKDAESIIHYLLNYISIMQSFEAIWQISDVDKPEFTYNKHYPDKIDALNTKKEIDYEATFDLVLNKAIDLKEKREEGYSR